MRIRFSPLLIAAVGAAALALTTFVAPNAALAQGDGATIRIAFVGDSMADGLWGAMFRRLGKDKCLSEKVKLLRRARNGTGLTRLDQYNWIDEVGQIAEDPGADLFFGSFGINDRQPVVEPDRKRTEPGSPAYDALYQSNVEQLIRRALASGDAVIIAGLPVLLDADANADALAKNKLFAAAVSAVGDPRAAYVEPWTSQPPPDEYKPFIPNARDTMTQLRATDGIHFTSFGYDLVMDHFFPAILAILKQRGRDLASECPPQVGVR